MTGASAKVAETNLLLHFVSHADMLTNYYSEELFKVTQTTLRLAVKMKSGL